MSDNNMKEKILLAIKRLGIDMVGFASKARFEGVDAQHNPFSIFPEAKTVILVGKRICRGALRGVEEGTNFGDYSLFGKTWLEDEFLAVSCYDLVRLIEDEGWEACPVFPNSPDIPTQGVAVSEGRPAPNVYPDFDYAAVACGLGEIGKSGLFLSPEYGSRQRFHMILTDAEIEETPLFEGSVCDGCGKCAESCPLGAIDMNHLKEITMAGKTMQVASIRYDLCKTCKNGACPNSVNASLMPDRIPALCNRSCLCHLEEEGLVGNRFERPFRTREAWQIGGSGDGDRGAR
ncbi:MAG: 4Fe-4S binding protein [Clostridia bacterium]|nr:4Fe-4S binding protein [Clostridia bacterium]